MSTYQQSTYGYYTGPPRPAYPGGPPPGYVATFDSNQYHLSINPAMIHQPMSASSSQPFHMPSTAPQYMSQPAPYFYGETGILYQPGPSHSNGYTQTNGHGNGNGHANGIANGHLPGPLQPALPPGMSHDGFSVLQYDGHGTQINGGIGKWKGEAKEGPIKNACLSCRSKKAKCDGIQPVCGQKKNLECVFVKSRRGGARKKKDNIAPSALQEFLKRLDGLLDLHDPCVSPGVSEPNDDTTDIVRKFASKEEILSCYYSEVHPFLPVMPQRRHMNQILAILLPDSPFLLAAQTIMVLVPHPMDPAPKSSNSKRLRTAASYALGQKTMQLVESLLSSGSSSLECVQALTMLSLWEWGNSGNLQKNRDRAGQAVQIAMEMGLHEFDKYAENDQKPITGKMHSMDYGRSVEGENWRADMARRTWWITYIAQLNAGIISGNTPILGADDPRIRVDYPVCSVSDNSWPNWINTNRMCGRVIDLVNSIYYGAGTTGGWGQGSEAGSPEERDTMVRKMCQADREVMEMMKHAESLAVIELVPGGEEEVVRNQQLSARLGLAVTHIHIHRQQAFPEVSLFSKRICGLPSQDQSTPAEYGDAQAQQQVSGQSNGNGTGVNGNGDAKGNGSAESSRQASDIGNALMPDLDGDFDSKFDGQLDFIDELWQPDTYPENLPAPWFACHGGAAALYAPTNAQPEHQPPLSQTGNQPTPPSNGIAARRGSTPGGTPVSTGTNKTHKAWGVDENDKPAPSALAPSAAGPTGLGGELQFFPPGISLARCATAAHTIVRLEVLHRSAAMALWNGPPKWLPFCACGLVSGAYAFLLLALAVQAEGTFDAQKEEEEVDKLLTNVKVILAGLEAYGTMWAGIDVMAGEVRAALEAATRLPSEVRAQIEAVSTVGGSEPNGGSISGAAAVNGNGNGSYVSPAPAMDRRKGSGESSIAPSHAGPSPIGVGAAYSHVPFNGNGNQMGHMGNGTVNPAQLTR